MVVGAAAVGGDVTVVGIVAVDVLAADVAVQIGRAHV